MERFENACFILLLFFACLFALSMVVFMLALTLGGNTSIPLFFAALFAVLACAFSVLIA